MMRNSTAQSVALAVLCFANATCGETKEAPVRMHPCGQGFASMCASPEKYAKLAAGAKNVNRLWRLGEADWSETLVDFSDRAFNETFRLHCGAQFGATLTKSCAFRVSLVVESHGGSGLIRYSEAADLEGVREPACVTYSNCVSAGYVDKKIRMPLDAYDVEALVFYVEALRKEDLSYDLSDPTFLRLTIETMQEDFDRLSAKDWQANKRHRLIVPQLKREIEFMKRKLEELE